MSQFAPEHTISSPVRFEPVVVGLGVLGCVLLIATLVALRVGAFDLPVARIYHILIGSDLATPLARNVFWMIRLPRVIMAVLVGSSLAMCGVLMQGVFRNPLADPGLIGVSSGAAVGAVFAIVFAGALGVGQSFGAFLIPVAAFGGGLLATLAVLAMSTRHGRTDVATMLLAGIAINALAGACIGLATYVSDESELRALTMWTLGSLGAASWTNVAIVAVAVVPAMIWGVIQSARLDLLLLGEAEARHLGVDVNRLERRVVLICALVVGASIGFVGIIGFVGLVVPHLLRLSLDARHRWVLPGSLLAGGALLLVADTVSRVVIAPAELPIGIVTSLIGGPFFLWLLSARRSGSWS